MGLEGFAMGLGRYLWVWGVSMGRGGFAMGLGLSLWGWRGALWGWVSSLWGWVGTYGAGRVLYRSESVSMGPGGVRYGSGVSLWVWGCPLWVRLTPSPPPQWDGTIRLWDYQDPQAEDAGGDTRPPTPSPTKP